MSEVATILDATLQLVRLREMDRAVREANKAREVFERLCLVARQGEVGAASAILWDAKEALKNFRLRLAELPEDVRLDAEHHVAPVLEQMADEIRRLRGQKRALARGRK